MKQWFRHGAVFISFCFLVSCATGGGDLKTQHLQQAKAFRQLGEAYLNEQNFTQALSKFIEAEKLNPDDYLLQQDLGLAYMAKGELETAVSAFKKSLDLKPDYAPARNNLGTAYITMGDWDSAIECFKMLTKDLLYATPHYPLVNLGRAYYEKKDFEKAEQYYQEALKKEPNFAIAFYGLGKTYLSMGKVQKAAEFFERATEVAPLQAEAYFGMADAYRLLGNVEKARKGYTKVMELSPESDLAKESRRELKKLE